MLKELFSSSARVQALSLLLLNPDTKFYQREIETITSPPRPTEYTFRATVATSYSQS